MCKSKKKNTKLIKTCKLIRTFFFFKSIVWKTRKNTFIVLIMHYTNKKSLVTQEVAGQLKKNKDFVVINKEANPFGYKTLN